MREFYNGKRVFVTGHTGFKGSWLCKWLLTMGAQVAGYSDRVPSTPSHFEDLLLGDQVEHIEGDVRDFDALKASLDAFAPEIVFHLAAQPIVRAAYDDPRGNFETNVMGMVNLLHALREVPTARVGVLITSDKAYENVEWEFGYREGDRLGGKDPYSASKACAEIVASCYARSMLSDDGSLRLATARAGNVIGGGDWAQARIVPDCIRAWAAGESVELRAPDATRPWQHVLEPLGGYLWLGKILWGSPDLHGEAFNFGPEASVARPVATLVEHLARQWPDPQWGIAADAARTLRKEAGLLKLCCDKALHHLSWQATLSFDETAQMTSRWYRNYHQDPASAASLTDHDIATYEALARERQRAWALA